MPVSCVAVFLEQLRECSLLSPEQLNEVKGHSLARAEDPVPLAKLLLQRGWLTPFQAQQVLKGRGPDLMLGSYRLLSPIGEGGMGQVFKAYHAPLDRTVALKLIRKDRLTNPVAVQRFFQEIRVAAQLSHPNIVTAFDAGQLGGTHYIAMEYVNGIDLARLVKESGPLPVEQACDCIRQAALGLEHALERGLVHRDIKPANLLLARSTPGTRADVVKILDMGLARLQNPEETTEALTKLGTIVGTPEFLAPEQAINSSAVDIRADIYSLGCTFYFVLTGKPPFQGASVNDLLLKHHSEPVPALARFRTDVPAEVEEILRKMLAKRPEGRFQTPVEVADALTPFAQNAPARQAITAVPAVAAVAPTTVHHAPTDVVSGQFRRQGQRRWKVAALLLLALGLSGLVLAFQSSPSERKPNSGVAQAASQSGTPTRTGQAQDVGHPPVDASVPDPSGTWKWTTSLGNQGREMTLKLKLAGHMLTGTCTVREGKEVPIEDVRFNNNEISFRVSRERANGQKMTYRYEGKINGDTIKGKQESELRNREWEAKRVVD